MSDHLPGNPYAEEMHIGLQTAASLATKNSYDERDQFALQNVAEALSAMAFEQRTANLLGLFLHIDRQGDLPDHAAELFNDIANRLGLRDSDE